MSSLRIRKCLSVGFVVTLVLVSVLSALDNVLLARAEAQRWIADSLVYDDNVNDESWPSMATDSSGNIYVAYQHYDSALEKYRIYLSKSTNAGQAWTLFYQIAKNTSLLHPSLAIDPYDDRLFLAYENEITQDNHHIQVSIYNPGSGWSEANVTDARGMDDRYPCVVSEYQFGANNYQYLSYETVQTYDDRDVNVHKSTDHGLSWPLWHDWNYVSEPTTRTQTSLATSQNGYVYLAFVSGSTYEGQKKLNVQYGDRTSNSTTFQHTLNLGDSFGVPAGASWPSMCASHYDPQTIVVAFQIFKASTNDDVYYAYTYDGGMQWSWGVISNTPENERYPVLSVDGQGSTSANVSGYFRVAYYSDVHAYTVLSIHYKQAYYNALTSWFEYSEGPNPITSGQADWASAHEKGLALTTQKGGGAWWPNAVWTYKKTSSFDLYSTTPANNPIVPEFPSQVVVPLFMLASLLAVMVYTRKIRQSSVKSAP